MIRVCLAVSALLCAIAIASQSAFAGGADERARIQQAGFADDFEDSAEDYASGAESFWDNLRDCVRERRLLGYKRVQKKHRKFLYPECSPACSPTFGYHHTQWRQFPECDYVWTSEPSVPAWPTHVPAESPATLSPMLELTPEATEPGPLPAPYFPEPSPQASPVQPAIPPAPPAEPPVDSGAVSLPVQADSLIDLVSQPQIIPNPR
jgi:hypothetical protein